MSGILKRAVSVLLTSTFILASACVVTGPVVVNAQVRTENVESVAQTLRSLSITLQDGSILPVSEIKEDYVAFIFGRTGCAKCNAMTTALDLAQKNGKSVHKVFLPIESSDTSDFIKNHPGTLSMGKYDYWNNNLASELCSRAGLKYGQLPAFFMLDKNRNIVFASTDNEETGLYKFFGLKGAESVDIKFSTDSTRLEVGDTFTVSAIVEPADAVVIDTDVSSSDTDVIEVQDDGSCIARKEGSAFVVVLVQYLTSSNDGGTEVLTKATKSGFEYFDVSPKPNSVKPSGDDTECCDPKSGTDNSQGSDVAPATDGNSSQTTGNDTAANMAKVKKPKASAITSLSKGKKQFTAKWKKVSGVKGYQLQYSTSSKFKSATTRTYERASLTKATIKKLKSKKTYYVRIRTYKMSGGKKVYSSWSKAAKVKTK